MERLYLERKLPNIIFVEGFWNVGKTTLINRVKKISGLIYVSEPNHLKNNVQKNISKWYKKQHKKRFLISIDNFKKGERVIMERSFLSSISYQYAQGENFSTEFMSKFKKIHLINEASVVFMYGNRNFIVKQSNNIKDIETKKLISKKEFYNRYLKFYKKILPRYINVGVNFIKVDKNNTFKTRGEIINLFYMGFPSMEKEKSICSSAVVYYKDKVLLLYDHKFKHFVLPQGHQRLGEKLVETAIRETTEETGFKNLKVIKKIQKYKYHYPVKDKIIYKFIHVYLLRMINSSKSKKLFESHENYSNRFFTPRDAIKKLKWPQDKKAVKKVLSYIKKSPLSEKRGL